MAAQVRIQHLTARPQLRSSFDAPFRLVTEGLDRQAGPQCGGAIAASAQLLSFEGPDAGSALYFRNPTALNDWFELTHAEPDGIVVSECEQRQK